MTFLLGGCLFISDDEQRQRLYETYLAAEAGDDSSVDGDTASGDDTGEPPAQVTPSVDSIVPGFATTAGGKAVTLYGADLSAVDTVRFGSFEAEIVAWGTGSIDVVVPEQVVEGEVDVVAWAGDEPSSPMSFEYIADGEGLHGLYGWMGWTDMVGNYWSDEPEDYGDAYVMLVVPSVFDVVTVQGMDVDESCGGEWSTGEVYVYDWGGTASLQTEAGNADLAWDADMLSWSAYPLSVAGSLPGAAYGLELDGLDIVEGGTMVPIGEFPPLPEVSEPSIAGSAPAQVSSSFTVRWQAGDGDFVAIQLGLWNSSGTGHQEFVTCLVADDGEFVVPSTAFTAWATDRQLDVMVERVQLGEATIPWNGASTSVWAYSREYGAVFTR